MSASRCPQCESVLTAAEANGQACPECGAALVADSIAEAIPVVSLPDRPRGRGRLAFVAGLVLGIALSIGGAAAAWWGWRPQLLAAVEDGRPVVAADAEPADQ